MLAGTKLGRLSGMTRFTFLRGGGVRLAIICYSLLGLTANTDTKEIQTATTAETLRLLSFLTQGELC